MLICHQRSHTLRKGQHLLYGCVYPPKVQLSLVSPEMIYDDLQSAIVPRGSIAMMESTNISINIFLVITQHRKTRSFLNAMYFDLFHILSPIFISLPRNICLGKLCFIFHQNKYTREVKAECTGLQTSAGQQSWKCKVREMHPNVSSTLRSATTGQLQIREGKLQIIADDVNVSHVQNNNVSQQMNGMQGQLKIIIQEYPL